MLLSINNKEMNSKKTLLFGVFMLFASASFSQSIGIGVSPQGNYKLDVNGRMRVRKQAIFNAEIKFDGANTPGVTKTIIGTIDENHTGVYGIDAGEWLLSANVVNGNVGIGTGAPAYKLDVNGQMLIRSNVAAPGTPNSGIFFQNTAGATGSFLGFKNDTLIGFKKNPEATWKYIIDNKHGYTGINTITPAATLDVNGLARFRGSLPQTGSTLTSLDVNGNAEWQDLVAFRVGGLVNATNQSIPENTWTKVNFNTTPQYNYGLNYQPFLSEFLAGEAGLYDFSFQLSFVPATVMEQCNVRVMQLRNGVTTEITRFRPLAKIWHDPAGSPSKGMEAPTVNYKTGNLMLQAGDKIWIETFVSNVYSPAAINLSAALISANAKHTWFYGIMKTRI